MLKELQNILYKVKLIEVHGTTALAIKDLQIDSRKVTGGSVFIAINGELMDGHAFIDNAIKAGAVAVVCEAMPDLIKENISYLKVADSKEAAAYMAHNYYDKPSLKLKLVGVTGTNGKTTIATVLFKLFTELGYKCGLLYKIKLVQPLFHLHIQLLMLFH